MKYVGARDFAGTGISQTNMDNDDTGGADPETAARSYKEDPSLDNYIRLRRANPNYFFDIGVYGGIDELYALESELKTYGIEAHPLMTGVLDAKPEAISELALRLLEHIAQARKGATEGKTHQVSRGAAMPESLIDWLICVALEAHMHTPEDLSPDLMVLIRERLGGAGVKQSANTYRNRKDAAWIGAQLKAQGVEPTLRTVGKIIGVAPSTITRWYPNNTFVEEVNRLALLFGPNGKMRLPIGKP